MWNYVMFGWEGGDCSGKDLWFLCAVFQWYQQWQFLAFAQQVIFRTFLSVAVLWMLHWYICFACSFGFLVMTCGTSCQLMFWVTLCNFLQSICWHYFQLDACQLALLSRQVRLIIYWCSPVRTQYHWDDWIGCLQQSSIFLWRFGSCSVEVGWGAFAIQFMNWT